MKSMKWGRKAKERASELVLPRQHLMFVDMRIVTRFTGVPLSGASWKLFLSASDEDKNKRDARFYF